MRRHLLILVSACLIALAGCGGDSSWQTRDISGLLPDLKLGLESTAGRTVSADDLQGQVVMLFFGFTHCPDICPATLARLSTAVGMLPETDQEAVSIVLVSVDPARDSAERLAAYAQAFSQPILALRTDDRPALNELTQRYRVTYGYGEPGPEGQYEVSHSSGVFVFDKGGDARLLIRENNTPEQIAADLQRLLRSDPPG